MVGTNIDGTYGTVVSSAEIVIDGNMEIATEIVQGNYEDTYYLKNIMESPKIELMENFKISSTSLLYDASVIETDEGLDGKLQRNNTTIGELANSSEKHLGEIFDKAIDDEIYRLSMSEDSKEIIDRVFISTSSKSMLSLALEDLSGDIYGNIPRQIFDIKDVFVEYDFHVISSIGDNRFNITYINSNFDVDSRYGIRGYKSKFNGFIGGVKISEGIYGTLGYGHSDINYNNDSIGKIDTIHGGLYKLGNFMEFDTKFGIIGEYSFNETTREIKTLDEKAKSDYNSYLVGANGEIGKQFGNSFYIRPAIGLELNYGRYGKFTEKGSIGNVSVSSEDYFSVLPSAEMKIGKKFSNVDIYAGVKYSYELGDMNKNQKIQLGTLRKHSLASDNLETSSIELKVGVSTSYKGFLLKVEAGKDYGKRDRNFVTVGFGYSF